MISIRNLKKSFGSNTVIQDISVDFADGEVISIIGPSGACVCTAQSRLC